ncbi:MAG TPA: ROK family protein, partial [Fimbriimonadaceae bacterium]|nr:ROK family protein [Fimbriimonadaceae bacterium]
ISEAAEKGDELAIEVWEEVGTLLGAGVGSLINVFAPDVFAIGGQIALAGELLLAPARKAARNVAIPSLFEEARIVQAEQISDAGILGGAALALETMKWKTA